MNVTGQQSQLLTSHGWGQLPRPNVPKGQPKSWHQKPYSKRVRDSGVVHDPQRVLPTHSGLGLTWTLGPHSGVCRGGGLYRTLPAGGGSCGGSSPSMAGPTASIRGLQEPGCRGSYLGFLLRGGGIMTWGKTGTSQGCLPTPKSGEGCLW